MARTCYALSHVGHWVSWFPSVRLLLHNDVCVQDRYILNVVGGATVKERIRKLWIEEQGQDVAEYAVMLAVILVIVIGTVRLIGGNANNVFSQVSSQMTQ